MGVTKNYNRDKDPDVNITGMAILAKAAEGAAATPADLLGADGIMQIAFDVDADPSGGAAVVDAFRVDNLQLQLDALGVMRLTGTIIPVLGDGSDGTPVAINQLHPQNMDAFQTLAGFPRVA